MAAGINLVEVAVCTARLSRDAAQSCFALDPNVKIRGERGVDCSNLGTGVNEKVVWSVVVYRDADNDEGVLNAAQV